MNINWMRNLKLRALFYLSQIILLVTGSYKMIGEHDKALHGYSFLNLTEANVDRCLEKCLENCLCMSFQMCDGNECQLCSTNKYIHPSAFNKKKGCTSFVVAKYESKGSINQQCDENCFAGMNCCLTSKPCLNGGSCKPAHNQYTSTRYSCICPVGYTGKRCQNPIKSCRGYADGNRFPGNYRVFSDTKDLSEVFCDFDKDSRMAWTLIQSYNIQNVEQFRNSFYVNEPTRKVPPPSWHAYRISKSKMQSIQRHSRKWRITCQYDTEGVVYRDYIRAANDKIDILNFNGEECIEVEYIDVRGKNCSNCTVFLLQSHNTQRTSYLYSLHIDSWRSNSCSRELDGILCLPRSGGEDNFGYYHCQNTEHRCSASINATTQTWFGGD